MQTLCQYKEHFTCFITFLNRFRILFRLNLLANAKTLACKLVSWNSDHVYDFVIDSKITSQLHFLLRLNIVTYFDSIYPQIVRLRKNQIIFLSKLADKIFFVHFDICSVLHLFRLFACEFGLNTLRDSCRLLDRGHIVKQIVLFIFLFHLIRIYQNF